MNKKQLRKSIWILLILIFIPVIFAQESNIQCKDSDNGINYYIKGEVKGELKRIYGEDKLVGIIIGSNPNKISLVYNHSLNYSLFYDHCYDNETSKQLNEAYCDENNTIKSISYNCLYGCQDGACITHTITIEGYLKLIGDNIIIQTNNLNYRIIGNLTEEIKQYQGKRTIAAGYNQSTSYELIIYALDYEIFPFCGNQICEQGEDYQNCSQDCQLCIEEGDFALKEQICCSGLKWVDACYILDTKCEKNHTGYCTNCGDNICNQHENNYNCPSDCRTGIKDNICDTMDDGICDPDCKPEKDSNCEIKESPSLLFYIKSLLILIVLALILISILLLLYFRSEKIKLELEKKQSQKRKKYAKKINEFFENAVKQGYPQDQIKKMLIDQAWPEKIVNDYCNKFFKK